MDIPRTLSYYWNLVAQSRSSRPDEKLCRALTEKTRAGVAWTWSGCPVPPRDTLHFYKAQDASPRESLHRGY